MVSKLWLEWILEDAARIDVFVSILTSFASNYTSFLHSANIYLQWLWIQKVTLYVDMDCDLTACLPPVQDPRETHMVMTGREASIFVIF